MNKEKTFAIISNIAIFLLYEVLAFISFGLSNSFNVYAFVGIFLLILIIVGHIYLIKKDGISNLLVFLIPLVLLGLILSFSSFSSGYASLLTRILIPFAFISFAGIGYISPLNQNFKISNALLVIYGGLALITLLSYFATMVQYIPFYTIIHRNSYIYYNGARAALPIGSMAYFLSGFSYREVSVDYFSLFPSVLSTSAIALFFLSPKKETKKFVVYAIYAFIGLLALITMPTKVTLITDFLLVICVVLIILFGKNKINGKIFSRVLLVLLILLLIAFLVFFINAQSGWGFTSGLRNLIAGNPLLNKVFNANGFAQKYNAILDGSLNFNYWLGFMPNPKYNSALHLDVFSNSVVFDTILMSGLFGIGVIIAIFVIAIKYFIKYFKNSDDQIIDKVLIAGFGVSFIVYSSLNYDPEPYVFYSNLQPYFESGLFLVILYLFGYVYFKANHLEKEEKVEETNNEQEN